MGGRWDRRESISDGRIEVGVGGPGVNVSGTQWKNHMGEVSSNREMEGDARG